MIVFRNTADGQSSSNMTNLAIKGFIGIQAMAEMSKLMNESSDAEHYDVCRLTTSHSASPSWPRTPELRRRKHRNVAVISPIRWSEPFSFKLWRRIIVCAHVQLLLRSSPGDKCDSPKCMYSFTQLGISELDGWFLYSFIRNKHSSTRVRWLQVSKYLLGCGQ